MTVPDTEAGVARSARLVMAAENSLERLRTAAPGDVFAELGESLFWIVALAEARGIPDEPLILGLTWARNRITHGVLVVAPVRYDHGAELGYFRLGYTALGAAPSFTWLPRHAVPLGPNDRPAPKLEVAYDELISGKGVGDPLHEALELLR